jgi:hypothetical protein
MLLVNSVIPALACKYLDHFPQTTMPAAVYDAQRRKASLVVLFAGVHPSWAVDLCGSETWC